MRGTRNVTGENLLRWISFIDSITTFIIHHPFTLTPGLKRCLLKITANAKTGGTSKGNNVNGTSSLNASSLLLAATARARCVFVHVAVSVRLPSPRALRRNVYIYLASLCALTQVRSRLTCAVLHNVVLFVVFGTILQQC